MSAPGRPVPFAPHGAVDGLVCDSTMAKRMAICGRFGSSCGTPFLKNKFIREHRQYEMFAPYLVDRPSQPWTIFQEKLKTYAKTYAKKAKSIQKTRKNIKNKSK
jgi:hypothetical protein